MRHTKLIRFRLHAVSMSASIMTGLRILAACLAGSAPCHVQMWRRAPGTIRRRGQPTERPLVGATAEAECWPPLQNGRVSMLLKFALSLLLLVAIPVSAADTISEAARLRGTW